MQLLPYLKSIVDQDECAVVICNLQQEILHMNPSAVKRYEKRGGASLIGKSLLACHNSVSCMQIASVLRWFSASETHNRIFTFHNPAENKDVYMIALRGEDGTLIGYYEKHEFRDPESQKPYDFV